MVSERVKGQIDRLLDDGEDASAQRDWEGGRGRTQHVRTFDPQSFGGLAFLAAAARSLKIIVGRLWAIPRSIVFRGAINRSIRAPAHLTGQRLLAGK